MLAVDLTTELLIQRGILYQQRRILTFSGILISEMSC